jgi:threonine/homoserine/homoserine lactone efflux protein
LLDPAFFLRGFLIGLSIAAPVGPIGVLCIRRTLAEGRLVGFVSGLGAATADATYGAIAGFGLTFISALLVQQERWIHLVGGIFLLYLGFKTFRSVPSERAAAVKSARGLAGTYGSTLFLTLTNPLTILSFVAIFAGFGLASNSGSYLSAGILVLGVFLGSATWWLLLSGGVGLFRSAFSSRGLQWVNRFSGALILGFGVYALQSLVTG